MWVAPVVMAVLVPVVIILLKNHGKVRRFRTTLAMFSELFLHDLRFVRYLIGKRDFWALLLVAKL